MSKTTSRFLVHFFEVHWAATTSHLLMLRFMAELKIRRIIFFCLFELDEVLKNLTPGKIA